MPYPPLHYYHSVVGDPSHAVRADVVVYGATPAGIMAAVQLSQLRHRVVLVELGRHVGGITASGLGATDIGNKAAIGGLAREFYRRLGTHYGVDESWTFEPHVAEATFLTLLREAEVSVYFNHPLARLVLDGRRIVALVTENGSAFRGRVFIDATYEGDLLAAAGVSHTIGREGNAIYDEAYNGVAWQHPGHQFKVAVDPYVVRGKPGSGLLPGVFFDDGGRQGDGDHRVQAYNFRLCLSDAPNRRPWPKPAHYDPQRYELLTRYVEAGVWDALRLTTRMPNGKTDTNNFGAVSSDNIGHSHRWPAGNYAERETIFQDHVAYHQGLMWFLANEPRVPRRVRDEVGAWGLPADEFPETVGWPHQLYVREARRMISDYIMTEHDCVGARRCDNPVGLAAYTMDSHACNRVVRAGRAFNEGLVEIGGFPPYPISYDAIVPRRGECSNLLVPVCLSASHIAYGSIRMEPVFMSLGQGAAFAAHLALIGDCAVQDVPYPALREHLVAAGQPLSWTAHAFAPPPSRNP